MIKYILIYLLLIVHLNALELNDEEKTFIEKNNIVNVGLFKYKPLLYKDNGYFSGVSGDIIELVAKKSGLAFRVNYGTFGQLKDKLYKGDIDILPAAFFTPLRAKKAIFTKPYFGVNNLVYVKKSSKIDTLDTLKTLKIAIIRSHADIEKFKETYKTINLVQTDSLNEAIKLLFQNKVDGFYSSSLNVYANLTQSQLSELKEIKPSFFKSKPLYFMINKDQKIISSIFNKALNDITDEEYKNIVLKYIDLKTKQNPLELSEDEILYRLKNPVVNFSSIKNMLPYCDFKDEEFVGIANDYIKEVQKKSSLVFELNQSNYDIFVDFTESKHNGYTQSEPFFINPVVLIQNSSKKYLKDISKLKGQKIVILKGLTSLKEKYKSYKLLELDDIDEALLGVSMGKYDALIAPMAISTFAITQDGITNLKVVSNLDSEVKLTFFIKDNKTLLKNIISKSLKHIDLKTEQKILASWVKQKHVEKDDNSWMFNIATAIIIMVMLIIFFQFKISQKVDLKTKELQKEIYELQEEINRLKQ